MLCKDGVDMRVMCPKASFYRYRPEFLKKGLELPFVNPQNLTISSRYYEFFALNQSPKFQSGIWDGAVL